jgi:PAS domain S-box-containing protein
MNRPSVTPWRLYLLLAVLGLAMVTAMLYVLDTGTRANTKHLPLIGAAVQIQLQATTAHLWFEEILSGDRNENMDDVWRHLESADWYAGAMLDGGRNADFVIDPLDDPRLRSEIEEVRRRLVDFRRITQERWDAQRISAAGTGIDQRYDEIFEEFVSLAENVEEGVRLEIASDLRVLRRVQISLIVGLLLLTVLVGLVIARYIEQRRRAEGLLRRSEEELRLTFEATPIAVAVLDRAGRFLRVNFACCEMLGYEREELRAMRLEDLTHPDDLDRTQDLAGELVRGDVPSHRITSRYLRKDGSVLHGLIHARRIVGVDGKPAAVGQILDRTKEVDAEEEARLHRERLAHVVRVTTMGEMASGIAHEINQPLTAISAFAQACQRLVRSDSIDSAELTETLGHVSAQARRAGEVIRRLRAFISKRERERERAAVNDLVEDTIKLLETDASLHEHRIEVQLSDDLPELFVDAVQIQQVLLNLVRNGLEAMQGTDSDSTLIVQTSHEDGEVEIRVVDCGVGLSPEVAEFDRHRPRGPCLVHAQPGSGNHVPRDVAHGGGPGGPLTAPTPARAYVHSEAAYQPPRSFVCRIEHRIE